MEKRNKRIEIGNYYTIDIYGFVKVLGLFPDDTVLFKTVSDNKSHEMRIKYFEKLM